MLIVFFVFVVLLAGDVIVEVDESNLTGYKEVAVRGNYCFDDNPFAHDLLPGEKILKEQYVCIKSPSLTWVQKLLVIFTCGLYYLYLQYCGCCRPRELFGGRAKLAVTSHARMLLWDSDIHGTQSAPILGCIPGFKKLASRTTVSTFSLRKLSYVERGFTRDRRCFGLCGARLDSSLRLFFNDYPSQMHVDAMQFAPLPRAVTMSKLMAIPNQYWWNFAFYRFNGYLAGSMVESVAGMFRGIFGSLTAFIQSYLTFLHFLKVGWGTLHVLEISSPYNDKQKQNGSDWLSLIQLEKTIVQMRNPPNCITAKAEADPEKWTMVNGPVHLVEGHPGRVNLRERDLALQDDEHVVDVFPNTHSWTLGDIVLTIVTASLYYWFVMRKKLAVRGALVITNKRLFEIYTYTIDGHYDPLEEGNIADFHVVVRFWLFGRLSQGFIEWNNDMVYAHIKTKYGGLEIFPVIQETNCCVPMCYGIREEYKIRMKNFLLKLAATDEPPLLGEEYKGDVGDCWTTQNWSPAPHERPLKRVESEFSWDCQSTCQKYLNCGCQPLIPAQEFVISTHRLWATARASNTPWCLVDIFNARNDVIYWKPLKDVKGYRVIGNASFNEDCVTRYCNWFSFCNPLGAEVRMEIATTKGYPIGVRRHGTYPKYGKMAEPVISEFRALMSQVVLKAQAVQVQLQH